MYKFKYLNHIYRIELCVNEDIPFHLERVYRYFNNDVNYDEQTERMKIAVANNTAFKLINENNELQAVFYYEQIAYQDVLGIAFWSKNKRMFLMFFQWFRSNTYIQYIYVNPHNNHVSYLDYVDKIFLSNYKKHGGLIRYNLFSGKAESLYQLYHTLGVEEV